MRSTYKPNDLNHESPPLVYYLDRRSRFLGEIAQDLRRLLYPEEETCLQALQHPDVRDRFATSRAVLRLQLFSITGRSCVPGELFADGCNGPPLPVVMSNGSLLSFSISHSKNIVCFAFNVANRRIGVDIESRRTVREPLIAAEFAFSQTEITVLRNAHCQDRNELFLRLWTRKEAVVKCYGSSIARDMDRFTVPSGPTHGPWVIRPDLGGDAEEMNLIDLDFGSELFGSVCWRGRHVGMSATCLDSTRLQSLIAAYPERTNLTDGHKSGRSCRS